MFVMTSRWDGNDLFLAPLRHGTLLGVRRVFSNHGNETVISANKHTPGNPPLNCRERCVLNGWIPLSEGIPRSEGMAQRQRRPEFVNKGNGGVPQDTERASSTTLVLGRADFLSSLFAACGCSTNVLSSKNKCKDCREVMAWAGNLSRQMLRIEYDDNNFGTHRLASRGSLAAVIILVDPSMNECGGYHVNNSNFVRPVLGRGGSTSATNPPPSSQLLLDPGDNDAAMAMMLSCSDGEAMGSRSQRFGHSSSKGLQKDKLTGYEDDLDEISGGFVHDPREWSEIPISLCRGMRVMLRYEDYHLDFLVVSQMDFFDHKSRNNDVRSYSRRIAATLQNLAFYHNECNREQNTVAQEWELQTQSQTQSCWLHHPPSQSSNPMHKQNDVDDHDTNLSMSGPLTHHGTLIPRSMRIWFCPRGQDMPRKRIEILTNRLRDSQCGVEVVDDYRRATHWVISGQITLSQVARVINTSEEMLQEYLDNVSTHVILVKPRWLDMAGGSMPIPPPSAMDLWYGFFPKTRMQKRNNCKAGIGTPHKKQRTIEGPRNLTISECFLKLSKIYEQAPYLPDDKMKARQYHWIAGRLQKIDFELSHETPIAAIRTVPGIGLSTAGMIQEILETGRLRRLECFQRDPIRKAMRNLMSIWGVGRATAMNLIHLGYLDIRQVRHGINSGDLSFLDWRQRIGVECYEDFLEDMSRSEVEAMFDLIKTGAQKILPGCEAEIMGSYRRGKDRLGDLDVLIVSKEHEHNVPPSVISELVNNLTREGNVAHHLTLLSGLGSSVHREGHILDDTPEEASSVPDLPSAVTVPFQSRRKEWAFTRKSGSVTYMGVFNSPTCRGKRRRVDIKFWPYSQRPYACLYFTGGKYFNRSMRQYAKAKFNWKLNDRGIFDIGSGQRLHSNVRTEEQVFEKLQIMYKAPPDRNFFDDVHPIADSGI